MFWKTYLLWISLFHIILCNEAKNVELQKPNTSGSFKTLNRIHMVDKRGTENQSSTSAVPPRAFDLIIPEECKKVGICEDIPNYPEEIVNQIVIQLQQGNTTRFNKDAPPIVQVAARMGQDTGPENIELCTFKDQIFAPRAAQDINKDWYVIINNKTNPQQTFRVEMCKENSSSCNRVALFFDGYEGQCIQKYMLRKMMALNEKHEVVEKHFAVPSCCSCVAKLTVSD